MNNTTSNGLGYNNHIYLFDTVTYKSYPIQWVPKALEYSPESEFTAIASPARNNPLYHYGGSEDTLNFEIEWLANNARREDVIQNCRNLEALTKNNGSEEGVHPVRLVWGKDDKLFGNSLAGANYWLLVNAKYTLTDFHKPNAMYPTIATQTITLKRITENNLNHDEIQFTNLPSIPSFQGNPDELAKQFMDALQVGIDNSKDIVEGNTNPKYARSQYQKKYHGITEDEYKMVEGKKIAIEKPAFLDQVKPSRLRAIATRIGKEEALSAVNFFANDTVGEGISLVGGTTANLTGKALMSKLKNGVGTK
jgi:hypothetical protein